MKHLLFWLSGFLPCRIISDDGRPYLERYYIGTLFGVRFYLHRFVGSDPARGLHDHPWSWAGSLVLSGWYWEELRGYERHKITKLMAILHGTTGIVRRRVAWVNWLIGDNFHRVVLPQATVSIKDAQGFHIGWGPADQPCWTLFFHHAEYIKPWGFLKTVPNDSVTVWVPHNYPKDGSATPGAWWNEVPIGKLEQRRQKCQ